MEDQVTTLLSVAHENADLETHKYPTSSASSNIGSTSSTDPHSRRSNSCAPRDAFVSFSKILSRPYSACIPDNGELQLPFFLKREFFSQSIEKFNLLYPARDPSLPNYFFRYWYQYCWHINVRRCTCFSVCDVFMELIAALKDVVVRKRPAHDIV